MLLLQRAGPTRVFFNHVEQRNDLLEQTVLDAGGDEPDREGTELLMIP